MISKATGGKSIRASSRWMVSRNNLWLRNSPSPLMVDLSGNLLQHCSMMMLVIRFLQGAYLYVRTATGVFSFGGPNFTPSQLGTMVSV